MLTKEQEREVLRHHYLDGWPPSKIAKRMKLPLPEVKNAVVFSWKELKMNRKFPADSFMIKTGLDYDPTYEKWYDVDTDLIGFLM